MNLDNTIKNLMLFVLLLSVGSIAYAQRAGKEAGTPPSKAELAKAAQNPVANLISVPFQTNINTGIGPDNETQTVLNIQPVLPVSINKDWNLITRTVLPVISQPAALTGDGRQNGLGDTTFTAFLSPSNSGRLIWGIGPTVLLPTASDDTLGSDKWGAGASVVLLTMPGNWVIGSLFSNVWSVGGSGNQNVNLFTWQYFINYNLPKGWYLTSAPIITANWEADSSNTWTIPVGAGIGKIVKAGKLPINVQASAYKNIETPEFGPDWQFRLQAQLLFPK